MGKRALIVAALVVLGAILWLTRDPARPVRGEREASTPAEEVVDREKRPAPTERTPAAQGVFVKGQVIDDRRRPVGDARIVLHRDAGEERSGSVDKRGRFRIPAGARPEQGSVAIFVQALSADGLAGVVGGAIEPESPTEVDVGKIMLSTRHDLEVTVVHKGAPVADARVVLVHEDRLSRSPFWEQRTDQSGRTCFAGLRRATLGVHAVKAGLGRGHAKAKGDQATVLVDLTPARTVTVNFRKIETDRPIVGATYDLLELAVTRNARARLLLVPALSIPPTDEGGRSVVEGLPPEGNLHVVNIRAPGYPPYPHRYDPGRPIRNGATETTIRLAAPRTVRWPVDTEEYPAPPDGATIRLRRIHVNRVPNPLARARMEGRTLVGTGLGNPVGYHAIAPDGSIAHVWAKAGQEIGPEIVFRPGRRIEFLVREPDGTPVEGLGVVLRMSGTSDPILPLGRTDHEGRVVFRDVYSYDSKLMVQMLPDPAHEESGFTLTKVDAARGDLTQPLTIAAERELTVRVRLDGKPGLPSWFLLHVNGQPVFDIEEDPERGELRFAWRQRQEAIPLRTQLLTASHGRAESAVRNGVAEFDLLSGGRWTLVVAPPKDGAYAFVLERWDEERRQWRAPTRQESGVVTARSADRRIFLGLELGVFRAYEASTGQTTEPVQIGPGSFNVESHVDLSATGWVVGHVEAPPGTRLSRARVVVEGLERKMPEAGVGTSGRFQVRIPGNRTVTLRARHPELKPAGEAVLRAPRDGLVLRLE